VADGDRQFLLSVFLMEAWDTLAAVEDGLAALRGSADSTGVVENLAVVTHRLRGSAALSGFPQLAGLAAAMEEAVERTTVASAGDRRSLAALGDMVFSLKAALDTIGETGVEDAEAIAEALAALAPRPRPRPPTRPRVASPSSTSSSPISPASSSISSRRRSSISNRWRSR
jgi:chemosensory pili system protein ChpA (sensor histidine kinase/response regulator)